MPRTNKPHARARARAARALELRLAGRCNADIAAALGYASEAGARMAIDRELNRRTAAGVDTLRREHGQRLLSLLSACWDTALGGDTDAIRTAKQLLDSISKLYGLDAAMQVNLRAGISEREFAQQAAELIDVINGSYGPGSQAARALADAVPGVAAELPAAVRAELFTSQPNEDDDDDSWCNIGPESACAAPIPAPEAPHLPAAENLVVSSPEGGSDDQDTDDASDDCDPEVVEAEDVAKLVPLPPSQRRVPASEVINDSGVPLTRTGYARRLGGYDPLAHWRP
ncbi:hypothetical protein [Mycobacterium asiaticum]|uniref:hypothetical protein n=1 Tax=Mycobacterium asiaticum TaxID=1790 RepID=UPI0007EF010F|nr:hypothetical protein [Mycobacterium asiaticum]OBI92878.1 hypothetical protein A5661_24925 [Mycobacterium asiaticum]